MSKRKPPEFLFSDNPEFHGDRLRLSLRTWVPTKGPKDTRGQKPKEPKPRKVIKREYGDALTFVFDTETTTDMAQQLRFGVWFLYRHDELARAGLFYDPLSLTQEEQKALRRFAASKGALVHTDADFVDEILMYYMRAMKATVVLANALFDFSRLAHSHYAARNDMAGGFGFKLARRLNPKWVSRVLIKNLGSRKTLIKLTPETNPKRGLAYPGYIRPDAKVGV